MAMTKMTLNTEHLKFRYYDTIPVHKYTNGVRHEEQERDENTGYLLWKIDAQVVDHHNKTSQQIRVTIAGPDEPIGEFDGHVEFANLTASNYAIEQNLVQTFVADAMKPTKPGGNKKPTAHAPAAS